MEHDKDVVKIEKLRNKQAAYEATATLLELQAEEAVEAEGL